MRVWFCDKIQQSSAETEYQHGKDYKKDYVARFANKRHEQFDPEQERNNRHNGHIADIRPVDLLDETYISEFSETDILPVLHYAVTSNALY
jgi:hypothetical protein